MKSLTLLIISILVFSNIAFAQMLSEELTLDDLSGGSTEIVASRPRLEDVLVGILNTLTQILQQMQIIAAKNTTTNVNFNPLISVPIPNVTVNNNIPSPVVNVNNQIPVPNVSINNQINNQIPVPNVTVSAPNVNVNANVAAPNVTVNNNVPVPSVTNNVNVPETNVTIINNIPVPNITVLPPEVNVNPTIIVQPPQINITLSAKECNWENLSQEIMLRNMSLSDKTRLFIVPQDIPYKEINVTKVLFVVVCSNSGFPCLGFYINGNLAWPGINNEVLWQIAEITNSSLIKGGTNTISPVRASDLLSFDRLYVDMQIRPSNC